MTEELDPLAERDQNEGTIRKQQLIEALDDDEKRAIFIELLGDERVRDLLWEIMEWCGIHADPMHSNFGMVAYGLGKAAIGKRLLVKINESAPVAWRLMQEKAALLALQRARANQKPRKPRGRPATP